MVPPLQQTATVDTSARSMSQLSETGLALVDKVFSLSGTRRSSPLRDISIYVGKQVIEMYLLVTRPIQDEASLRSLRTVD